MSICYKCDAEEDYTDQFAVVVGGRSVAACWNCYKAYHMTDEQRLESDCSWLIQRVRTAIDLPCRRDRPPFVTATEKVEIIKAILAGKENGSWEALATLRQKIEKEHAAKKQAILAKLTPDEQDWLR